MVSTCLQNFTLCSCRKHVIVKAVLSHSLTDTDTMSHSTLQSVSVNQAWASLRVEHLPIYIMIIITLLLNYADSKRTL